jgi:hypothetical protein
MMLNLLFFFASRKQIVCIKMADLSSTAASAGDEGFDYDDEARCETTVESEQTIEISDDLAAQMGWVVDPRLGVPLFMDRTTLPALADIYFPDRHERGSLDEAAAAMWLENAVAMSEELRKRAEQVGVVRASAATPAPPVKTDGGQ